MTYLKYSKYGPSFSGALEQANQLIESRSTAPLDEPTLSAICQRLLSRNAAQQALLVRNSSQAGRLEVSRRLVGLANEGRVRGDHDRMLRAAHAAVVVSSALSREQAGRLVYDARTEAWACLANAHRIQGDRLAAERAWAQVPSLLAQSSGEPLLQGKMLELEASLRGEQQHFDRALLLLERAQEIYELIGEDHLSGRCLISRAHTLYSAGDPDRAIEIARQGQQKLDRERDPHLWSITFFNLALYLGEANRTSESLEILEQAAPLWERMPRNTLFQLRLRWMEGRMLAATGARQEGARQLDQVRRELIERDLAVESAFAALDLAAVYADLGHNTKVVELAREMYPIFAVSQVPREAVAALLLASRAAQTQTLSAATIRTAVSKLRRTF